MYGIKNILTLVDLSTGSNPVIEAALTCSKFFNASLILYHASPNLFGEAQLNELKERFENTLLELKKVQDCQDIKSQIIIASEDFPSGKLLKQVITDVELVVIGGGKANAGDTKREKVVKIVDTCEQPILVIPRNRKMSELKHILYCSSYQDLSANDPLEIVKYIAEKFNSEVRVAHVKTHSGKPNEDHVDRSRMEGAFFEPEVKYSYKLIRSENVIEGIGQYIKKKGDNDLLVMIRRKHHIFDRIFGKNFTYRMLQHTEIPLLIIKEPQLN